MKKWIAPTIDELDLKYTSTLSLGAEDELSGEEETKQQEHWDCVATSEEGVVYWQGTESQEGFHQGWLGEWGK